jgi:hypothetical protein
VTAIKPPVETHRGRGVIREGGEENGVREKQKVGSGDLQKVRLSAVTPVEWRGDDERGEKRWVCRVEASERLRIREDSFTCGSWSPSSFMQTANHPSFDTRSAEEEVIAVSVLSSPEEKVST